MYIGRKVVVEEQTADGCTEHAGVLKEYTAGWIEVLDCRRPGEHRFVLTSSEQLRLNRDLDFTLRLSPADGGGKPRLEVRVTNRGRTLVKLLHLQKDEYRHPLDLDVPPGRLDRVQRRGSAGRPAAARPDRRGDAPKDQHRGGRSPAKKSATTPRRRAGH